MTDVREHLDSLVADATPLGADAVFDGATKSARTRVRRQRAWAAVAILAVAGIVTGAFAAASRRDDRTGVVSRRPTDAMSTDPGRLIGSTWRLAAIDTPAGRQTITVAATMTFRRDGTVTWKACNRASGPITIDRGMLRIRSIASTVALCRDPERQAAEDTLTAVMQHEPQWFIDGGGLLRITSQNRLTTLVFHRA